MRRCHGVHVVALASRRRVAMKFSAVPRGSALRFVRPTTQVGGVGFAEHNIGLAGSCHKGFDFRNGVRDSIQVGGRDGIRAIIQVVTTATTTAT